MERKEDEWLPGRDYLELLRPNRAVLRDDASASTANVRPDCPQSAWICASRVTMCSKFTTTTITCYFTAIVTMSFTASSVYDADTACRTRPVV
jgi:hypothetical protein